MKTTTRLWALCACLLLITYNTHAQTTYAQFGSTPGEINDDGTGQLMIGQVGIGGTSAAAKLHVKTTASTDPVIRATYVAGSPNPDYYFLAERLTMGAPPSFNITTRTDLVINNQGYIGIGADDPEEPLYIKHHPYYTPTAPYYSPFASNRSMVVRDVDGYDLFTLANTGTGTTHGGGMLLLAAPDYPALAIHNGLTNSYFLVAGDGSVGLGLGLADQPEAQLDIRTVNGQDYLLNIANSTNTAQYVNVHKDGNVGIGVTATGTTARLSVKESFDLYYNSSVAPVFSIKTSGGVTRHLITDIANNLIIAPGIGGGANNRVAIAGEASIAEKGILYSGVDMSENDPGSNGWYNQIAFRDAAGTSQQVLCNAGTDLILNLNPFGEGSGKLKVAGSIELSGALTVKSGSGNEFKVGTDGKVRAREVQVDLQTIPDYVFDKNYELPTIEELSTFISENKHLPNIPSECEYEQRGAINIAELNVKLLEKVEELSLYIIQLNERIKTLENEK